MDSAVNHEHPSSIAERFVDGFMHPGLEHDAYRLAVGFQQLEARLDEWGEARKWIRWRGRGDGRHAVQSDVEAFHWALDIPVGSSPAIRRPQLRADLIEKEATEACEAIRAGDLVEAIDGLCDLLCVVYGAAIEFGINLAPFWNEVHRTNMAKTGGSVREDGKRLKPEGWTPPDIAGILAAYRKEASE
jgi:hypothetical protein